MQQEEKKLSLDEIHAELLEQLRDITAVCKKHNISYNMMCGSLLGAVRHKGFIPWDDDVDLLMTREEFQKFREIYPKECDKRFELTYLDTWTPRVMNRDPEKAAAFTDFFILDPVPPEGFQRKWWFFKLHTLQGMLKKNVDWSRFNWKNKILIFGTHVLGLPFSVKTKTRWYEQVSRQEKTGNDLCMSNGAFELMMHIWHPDQFRGDFADLCVHRVPRHLGGIDGDFMLPAQHARAGDMVNMFVGDENGVNGVAINANHIQCFINHFARLSGVDEQAGCAVLHEEAVAARTGVEGAENHFHWIPFWIPVLTFFSAFFSRVQPKGTRTEKTSDKNQLT